MAETKAKKAKTPKKAKATEKVSVSAKTKKIEATEDATTETPKVSKTAQSGLADKNKQELIQLFATKNGDTGSPEVQVALATHKIFNLTAHLDQNPKDNHSRRGLLKVISKRRRILNYLAEKDEKRYKELVKKLELKK